MHPTHPGSASSHSLPSATFSKEKEKERIFFNNTVTSLLLLFYSTPGVVNCQASTDDIFSAVLINIYGTDSISAYELSAGNVDALAQVSLMLKVSTMLQCCFGTQNKCGARVRVHMYMCVRWYCM